MKLLILVWVAPQDPYPRLYSVGASNTWITQKCQGIDVMSGNGKSLNSFQRRKADVREQLRYSGSGTSKVGTVNYEGALQRNFDHLIEYANEPYGTFPTRFLRRFVGIALSSARQLSKYWERLVLSQIKNRRRASYSILGNHITFNRLSTLSNSSALVLDSLKWFVQDSGYDGLLVTTTGAYVDQEALREFSASMTNFDGFASAKPPGAQLDSHVSGFGLYFSKQAAERILADCNLDHSLPNDLALSKWAESRSARVEEIPTAWEVAGRMSQGAAEPWDRPVLYRCTQHWNRELETNLMQKVHARMIERMLPTIVTRKVEDAESETSH